MSSSKELSIKIQANLEAGNALENAKNLGQGIASAIESAFEGLGERIAASLILKMQGVLNNVKFTDVLSNNSNATAQLQQTARINSLVSQPMVEHPSGSSVPIGAASGIAHQPGGSVIGGGTSPQVLYQNGNATSTQIQSPRNDIFSGLNKFSYGNFGLGYMNRAFMGIEGGLDKDFSYAKVAALDTTHEEMRRVMTMKKLDPNYQVDEDLVKNFRSRGKEISEQAKVDSEQWKKLNETIPTLAAAFEGLKKSVQEYENLKNQVGPLRPDQIREKEILEKGPAGLGTNPENIQAELNKSQQELDRAQTERANLKRTGEQSADYLKNLQNQFPEPPPQEESKWFDFSAKNMKKAGTFGAAAFGASAYMQDYFPRQQAAQYQLDNMTGKSLLTGDMSRAFAIESLGGQEQLIKDANRKANYEADAMMAGGLGVIGTSLVASGAAATTGVGAILAPFIAGGGALAGAGMFGKGMLDRFYNSENVERIANEKISTAEKNSEIGLIVGQKAMGRAISSYNIAQSMGDTNLTKELYGASENPNDLNYGDRSYYKRAVTEFGLSGQQFDILNQKIVGTMGAKRALEGSQVYDPRNKISQLYGAGAYNIADVASTMFNDQLSTSRTNVQTGTVTKEKYVEIPNIGSSPNQSSVGASGPSMSTMGNVAKVRYDEPVYTSEVDPSKYAAGALEKTANLYQSVFSAGVDQKDVAGVVGFAAARAAASGPGAMEVEQKEMMDSLRLTRQVFGADDMNARNIGMVQQFNANLSDRARGSDGLAVTAGAKKLQMLRKEFKDLKLGGEDEYNLRKFKGDTDSVVEYFAQTGRKISKEDASKLVKRNSELTAVSMDKALSYLPESMRMDIISSELGAKTLQERNTISKTIKSAKMYNSMTDAEKKIADAPTQVAIPEALATESKPPFKQIDQKVVARYGDTSTSDKQTQDAKNAKKATEAGDAEAVSKGFGALNAITVVLTTQMGKLKEVVESIANTQVDGKNVFQPGRTANTATAKK